MFRGRNSVIIGIAVLLGIFVVFLTNAYFSGIAERQQRQVEQLKLVQVLVATQPLAFGTVLTAQNTKLVGWPASSLPAGVFRTSIGVVDNRSEEHTSELQSLMRISYAVFCLKKKKT